MLTIAEDIAVAVANVAVNVVNWELALLGNGGFKMIFVVNAFRRRRVYGIGDCDFNCQRFGFCSSKKG
jgi:hypothetical protein